MRSRLAAIGLVLSAIVGLAGCSGSEGSGGTTETTTADVSTTDPSQNPAGYTAYPDATQPVVVAVGRRFGLLVQANPSAGRRWQVGRMDANLLLPLGSELIPDNTALQGSPDTQVLTFVAQTVGSTTVELVEIGADSTAVPEVAPIVFTVVVTSDGLPPPPPPPPETTTTAA